MAEDSDRNFTLNEEDLHKTIIAVGQGALSGLEQLLRELEDNPLSPEAVARVRKAVGQGIRAVGLPEELAGALDRGMR